MLFARGDRDKEDWYRRFLAASQGHIEDQDLHLPNVTVVDDSEIKAATKAATFMPDNEKFQNTSPSKTPDDKSEEADLGNKIEMNKENSVETPTSTTFEGLIISNCAGRNSEDYVKFMALYQVSSGKLLLYTYCFFFIIILLSVLFIRKRVPTPMNRFH